MKSNTFINEDDLLKKAIDLLLKELGPVETKRFLSLIPKEREESVKRHRKWQDKLEKDTFFAEVFTEE